MKEFTITSNNVDHLNELLDYYSSSYKLFFKVWQEVTNQFEEIPIIIDYKLVSVCIGLGYTFKWINITNIEDYIRNQLLDLFVSDVDEYLKERSL